VPVTESYQAFVVEQMNRVVPDVRAKHMFGGVGLYSADLFFALIADDIVYLKADQATQPDFDARGLPPFRPFGEKGTSMRYFQIPEEALENSDVLREWVDKAVAVARRARSRPVRRRGS